MSMNKPNRWAGLGGAAAVGAVVALSLGAGAGCGGSDHEHPDASAPDPDAGTGSGGPPAVLVAERVFTPSGRFYYVSVLPDVPTAAIDRSKAIELTSADIEVFNDRVYIRDRDANTMTRYRVSNALELVQDGQLSFAPTGLGTGRASNAYVAADRAYVLDSAGWRLIGWNPTTMRLNGEIIALDAAKKDASLTGSISPAVRVGDRLIASVSWENFTDLVLYPGSGAIVIDTAPGVAPAFVETPQIGGAFRIAADASGDAYMIGVTGGDVHLFGSAFGGGALPTSGLVRLPAGATAFDTGYLADVEAITKTQAVWAIHRINATTLLAQILDPQVAAPPTISAYNASADFIYVTIDTVAKTFAPVAALPRGGRGNAGNHVVDAKLYIQLSNATGSVSYAVSQTGEVSAAFPIPAGDVWHLQRIR